MNSSTVLLIFELIGTVAFTVSGDLVGIKKKMDIFGIIIMGFCPAVGGGIIRDLILGITPPSAFQNSIYIIVSLIVSNIVFLKPVRNYLKGQHKYYDRIMLVMDSLGLGIFTVMGTRTALIQPENYGIFLLVFVGMITGVGGGILRDMLASEPPYVFVKHFYATASLIGSLVYIMIYPYLPDFISLLIGSAVIVVLRLLAAHYRWELPHAD